MKDYKNMTVDELFELYERLEQEKMLKNRRVIELNWQQHDINSFIWRKMKEKING